MDLLRWKEQLRKRFPSYRPVLIVLLAGILLMALPERKERQAPQPAAVTAEEKTDLEARFSRVLSSMDGAGKVQVLLSEAAGEQILYQFDEEQREGQRQRKTVLTGSAQRGEQGLVRQILPPRYQGAIVLCQGGNRPEVRLSIVKAVTSATGLTSDKVTVLKMN